MRLRKDERKNFKFFEESIIILKGLKGFQDFLFFIFKKKLTLIYAGAREKLTWIHLKFNLIQFD